MKLLYENTKACSNGVETKIDELKKVMVMQSDSLSGGRGGNSSMMGGNQAQMGGMFD